MFAATLLNSASRAFTRYGRIGQPGTDEGKKRYNILGRIAPRRFGHDRIALSSQAILSPIRPPVVELPGSYTSFVAAFAVVLIALGLASVPPLGRAAVAQTLLAEPFLALVEHVLLPLVELAMLLVDLHTA